MTRTNRQNMQSSKGDIATGKRWSNTMNGGHKEIELKLRVAPGDIAVIREHPVFTEVFQNSSHENLRSVYFDTDKRFLHNHGLTLRVRHIDGKRIQTIKTSQQGSDWIERSQWEQPIESDVPDLAHVADTALGPILTDDIRNSLKPVFETRIERTACHLNDNDTDVDMAIHEGQIVSAESSCPISEVELELKRGEACELFKVARIIGDIVPAQLDVKSKYERGSDLIEKKPVAAEKARNPELWTGMSAGRAFTMISRTCLRQLVVNTATTIERDVESLHQMRVALRRLRAAISLFSGFLRDERIDGIKAELRWLAGEFGPARNLDTLIGEVLAPIRKQHPTEQGLVSISRMFARQRLKSYRRAQEAVQSVRFRTLVLDTAEWIEVGPWSRSNDPANRMLLEAPIQIYAAKQLSRRFKKIRRRGAKIDQLSFEQLHQLRIQVKKARYATGFFSRLYTGRKATKRVKRVLSALTQFQDSLGKVNDIVTHKALFSEIIANPRRGMTAQQNHRRAFAAGLIIGDQQARIPGLLDGARKAYSRFADIEPFWKASHKSGGGAQRSAPPAPANEVERVCGDNDSSESHVGNEPSSGQTSEAGLAIAGPAVKGVD